MITLTACLVALTVTGAVHVVAGWIATVRFARITPSRTADLPPITILKPLYGDEPLLAEALTTLCEQNYPAGWQILCGVRDSADNAIPVVRALQARFPERDIELVIDPIRHGSNPKIGNLINMFTSAKHDLLVFADSDVHARPDYLRSLASALAAPGIGVVTVIYSGLPAFRNLAGMLGVLQITYGFLPGALLARVLGRRDCLGATMCLRRQTLEQVGGLAALKDHLADDNVLGRLVRAHGLEIGLARTVVATTVPERHLTALWRHELRWARTIRTLVPGAFAATVLQYPILLGMLTIIAAHGALWSWVITLGVWAIRAIAARGIDRALGGMLGGLAFRGPVWLLPLRDLLSAAEWLVSHAGRRVDWRGETIQADTPPRFATAQASAGTVSMDNTHMDDAPMGPSLHEGSTAR